MIKAVIYDMDGLIIDSEPLWNIAEKNVFKKVGINLSDKDCIQTRGLRVDAVVEFWYQKHPWEIKSKKEVEENIFNEIRRLVNEHGQSKPGVKESLAFFKTKGVKIALASSSPLWLIDLVLNKLKIKHYFEFIHSGALEKQSKPHPAIYLTTAKQLKVESDECLAIEDSLNGVKSAKNAGMKCVAIPEKDVLGHEDFKIADLVLPSLLNIDEHNWLNLNK